MPVGEPRLRSPRAARLQDSPQTGAPHRPAPGAAGERIAAAIASAMAASVGAQTPEAKPRMDAAQELHQIGILQCARMQRSGGIDWLFARSAHSHRPSCSRSLVAIANSRQLSFPRRVRVRVLRRSTPILRGGGAPTGARVLRHPAGPPYCVKTRMNALMTQRAGRLRGALRPLRSGRAPLGAPPWRFSAGVRASGLGISSEARAASSSQHGS